MTLKTKYLSITLFFAAFALSAQQGTVNVTQARDIDKLLEFKKDIKTSKFFTIQIDQSRDPDEAQSMKSNFENSFKGWPVDIVWNTPNYKIWVGNFSTRLEADRALAKIKSKYMNAIIFQPKSNK